MSYPDTSLIQSITTGAVNVTLGLKPYLQTQKLSEEVSIIIDDSVIDIITLRDLVRLTYAELGIELAFSGRDEHEKGVIIDIDEEYVAGLNLIRNALGFGQPVVRANAPDDDQLVIVIPGLILDTTKSIGDSISEILRESMYANLALSR